MILPLLIGTLSFVPMAASDHCFLHKRDRLGSLLFFTGCSLLAVSTLLLLLQSSWEHLRILSAVPLGLALLSLLLLVYSVFFAVTASPEDSKNCPPNKRPLSCCGMYALCRHPGVLWLGSFYGFMALTWPGMPWLMAFLLFTLADTLYVVYQDRYIFPVIIDRYKEYQQTTPFLIPTASSIAQAFAGPK